MKWTIEPIKRSSLTLAMLTIATLSESRLAKCRGPLDRTLVTSPRANREVSGKVPAFFIALTDVPFPKQSTKLLKSAKSTQSLAAQVQGESTELLPPSVMLSSLVI